MTTTTRLPGVWAEAGVATAGWCVVGFGLFSGTAIA